MPKDDILSKGAILQRDGQTYAIMTRLLGGFMELDTARRIAETAQKFGIETLKLTGDQRLALFGLKEEDLDAVYADLGLTPRAGTALCQQYLKVCPGNTFCSRGQRDTLSLAQKLHDRFFPYPKITSKVKVGVSGCFNSCTEPAIKDIGLIGLPKGWTVMVGGAGGKEPMLAETVARNLSDDQVIELFEKIMKYYQGVSMRPQTRNLRLGVILKKEGIERFRRVCGLDEA